MSLKDVNNFAEFISHLKGSCGSPDMETNLQGRLAQCSTISGRQMTNMDKLSRGFGCIGRRWHSRHRISEIHVKVQDADLLQTFKPWLIRCQTRQEPTVLLGAHWPLWVEADQIAITRQTSDFSCFLVFSRAFLLWFVYFELFWIILNHFEAEANR